MLKYGACRLLGILEPGDRALIEYDPKAPVELLLWRDVVPQIVDESSLLVVDWYGIGDVLFRNYLRKAPGKEYQFLIEAKKKVYVFKVGPGHPSYGQKIGEEKVYTDPEDFMRAYYWMIRKAVNLPQKPRHLLILGLAEYVYFAGPQGLQNIIQVTSAIPVEDWITIVPVNRRVLSAAELGILEDIASHIAEFSGEEMRILKGGRGSEERGEGAPAGQEGKEVPCNR
ncbi:DUF257 family protein [Thermococcus sp.]